MLVDMFIRMCLSLRISTLNVQHKWKITDQQLCSQIYEWLREESTISSLVPFLITGRTWPKSPPNKIVFAPKGFSEVLFITSRSVRSRASYACLCVIGASSQIISFVRLSKSARGLSGEILQKDCSVRFQIVNNKNCVKINIHVVYSKIDCISTYI